MSATITDNTGESRYEIHVDGTLAGVADYRIVGQTIHFTHTETDAAFGGRGLARQMIESALGSARAAGLAVAPECPFVRKVIADAPDTWLDLVPADHRAEFDLPTD